MKKRTPDYTQYIKPILPLRPVSHIGFKLPKTGGFKPQTSFLQPVKPVVHIEPVLRLRPEIQIGVKPLLTGGIKPITSFLHPVKPVKDYSEIIKPFFPTPIDVIKVKPPRTGGIKPITSFLHPVKPVKDYSEIIKPFFPTPIDVIKVKPPRTGGTKPSYQNFSEMTVTGYVLDENMYPLSKVHVVIQNKKGGTITNTDGFFKIKAPVDAMITLSHVGYVSSSYKASRMPLEVILKKDIVMLDTIDIKVKKKKSLTVPLGIGIGLAVLGIIAVSSTGSKKPGLKAPVRSKRRVVNVEL